MLRVATNKAGNKRPVTDIDLAIFSVLTVRNLTVSVTLSGVNFIK